MQAYNGEPIAWQFGVVEDGYSSLIVKVPNRKLTLILLANSDGLSAPFALDGRRRDDVDLRKNLPASLCALSVTARTARTATLLLAVVLCGPSREARADYLFTPFIGGAFAGQHLISQSRAGRRLDAA